LVFIQSVDHIICISQKTKKDLMYYFNVPSEKISVIYLGANLTSQSSEKKRENFILYVGSRKDYKNFEKFLYSFRSSPSLYRDFNIICFGGEKFTKYDRKILKSYQFDLSKIKFLYGDEKILKELYLTARLFVYPSLYEGFGLPILESMANSCPVLCSNTGSLPEIAGDSAMYFDPNNSESIKNAMENMIYDEDCLRILVKNGLERIKLFTWSACAEQTFKVYKNIIFMSKKLHIENIFFYCNILDTTLYTDLISEV
jgi:glycosyltransferase involved in cell wall biosynthesis